MTPERLAWHLDNWAQWMSEDDSHLGYPKRSAVIGISHGDGTDASLVASDDRCAEAVDAIVRGMTPVHRLTVQIRHGLSAAVFRIAGDPEVIYAEALRIIAIGLNRKGIP